MQGLKKGSPAFNRALRKEKVSRCMQMQDVPSCTECPRFTDCDLRLAYWRDMTLGPEYADDVADGNMGLPNADLPDEDD